MQLVKKSFIFAFILMISLSTLITSPQKSSASEEISEDPIILENALQEQDTEISPNMINPYRYSKENVSFSESWSGFKRISDNLTTGKKGGSISSSKAVSFKTDVSGPIHGINVSTGVTITNTIGYTLNVEAYKSVYMAYRVRYKVENGIHVTRDIETGKTVKKAYTVKTPMFGDYQLLNYK